jgi:hypothetical protein
MRRRLSHASPFISHQGGWDEALLIFGVPVLLFVLLRLLAGRQRRDGGDEGSDG